MAHHLLQINEGAERQQPLRVTRVPQSGRYRRKRIMKRLTPYLFIAPFFIIFLGITIGPYIYALILSFFRYRGYGDAIFVGWENYHALLTYHIFWTEVENTLFYWLAHTLPLMAIAFGLALIMRSKFMRGQRFFKPIFFLPNIIAIVAASLIFQSFFSTQYGVLNSLLHTHIPFLQDPTWARWVIVLLLIWRGLGFWFVVFLAGLTTVNPELEEAAAIDGATYWQRIGRITLPTMRPILLFAFILDAINSMRLYTEPNVLTANGSIANPEVGPILNLLVGNLNDGNFGASAATGWLVFVLTIVVALLVFGFFRATGEVQ